MLRVVGAMLSTYHDGVAELAKLCQLREERVRGERPHVCVDVLTAAPTLHLLEHGLHGVGARLVPGRRPAGPQVRRRNRDVRPEVVVHRPGGGSVVTELVRLQHLPDRGQRSVEVEGEAPVRDRQDQRTVVAGDLGHLRQPVDQVGNVLDHVGGDDPVVRRVRRRRVGQPPDDAVLEQHEVDLRDVLRDHLLVRLVERAEVVGVEHVGVLHLRFLGDQDRPVQGSDLQAVTVGEVLQLPEPVASWVRRSRHARCSFGWLRQPYVGYCGQPSGLSSQSCCRPYTVRSMMCATGRIASVPRAVVM